MRWRVAVVTYFVFAFACFAAGQQKFEDDRIAVAVPKGWSLQTAVEDNSGVPVIFTGGATNQHLGAALANGKYTLYLLTQHGQASGIRGGRFGEIAAYVAPWVDRTDPWACIGFLQKTTTKVTNKLSRVDLYFDGSRAGAEALAQCGQPSTKAVLWYGSYFSLHCPLDESPDCGGLFLNLPLLAGYRNTTDTLVQMAFTLSYRAKNPDELPRRDDAQLRSFLDEASRVVKSVRYKKP